MVLTIPLLHKYNVSAGKSLIRTPLRYINVAVFCYAAWEREGNKPYMRGIVIFDLDGTLLCTHHHILQAAKDTLRAFGLPDVSDETIIQQIGETSDVFCNAIAPGCADMERFKAQFRINERVALRTHGKLFDGIRTVLSMLAAEGFRLMVCSAASLDYIELALTTTGIKDIFHTVISSKGFAGKGEAIAKEHFTQCDNVIMVGDRLHDYIAASENQIPSVAALYGYGSADEISLASFTAETPEDIHTRILQITLYTQIYSKIKCKSNVRCVGVNGVDTSGKSVFASRFASFLKSKGQHAVVIHLDDFHNPVATRRKGSNEIEAYINNAFDINTLVEQLLLPIRNTGRVTKTLKLLDLDSDTYTLKNHYDIRQDTLVLLEGVLLYRSPIEDLIDFKIFLDISFEEVAKRASVRDVPKYGIQILDKYQEKYIPIQQWYLQTHNPKGKSDVVVDNSDFKNPFIL